MSVYAKKTYNSKVYGDDNQDAQVAYMNPFGKVNPPVNPMSLGNFCTVSNKSQYTISTNVGALAAPKIILFCPSIKASVNALVWNGSSGVVEPGSHNLSTMLKYGTSDTPLQSKALRAGLKITNTTNGQDRGSSVSFLQISSPLDLVFDGDNVGTNANRLNLTAACAQSIVQLINSHTRTQTYSAEYLATSKSNCLVAGPAVGSEYNSYSNEHFLAPINDSNSRIGFERAH